MESLKKLTLKAWHNPLLAHARRVNRLPDIRIPLAASAGVSLLVVIASWLLDIRSLGALFAALSLTAVMLPVFFAPVAGADRITRQMRFSKQDPRRLTDLPPDDVTLGLALVTLWKLRWFIIIALALTPALIISVFRLNVIEVTAWQASAQILGDATAGAQAGAQLGENLPVVRMAIRALTAGILPWLVLAPFSMLGITTALALRDSSLSPLLALLATVVLGLLLYVLFDVITWQLAVLFEPLHAVLIAGLMAGIGYGAVRLNRLNAYLFANPPDLLKPSRPSPD